jgi:uncharacterized protein (DUF1684 family)
MEYLYGTTGSTGTDLFTTQRQTNTEQTLSSIFYANRNQSIMLVVHTTSTSSYTAGGYLEVSYPRTSSSFYLMSSTRLVVART